MIQCPKCSVENLPESRFCSSCGQELSSLSQMPTIAAPEGEVIPSPVNAPLVGRIVSSDSVPAGGFTPGTILVDRYRIIGLLGRGGMGEVYRADDLKLGQPVALKFLPPSLAQDSVRRERFFAEVRITRQLSHPNICRVYDIGEVDGRHFLSMEYIDGEDLASLMKRIGHLSNEKVLDIARQLVAGLSVAHERGVLHRDLKPANIMLDGHGRVRITDFGLAIAVGDESQADEIAGTPGYMAPEQLAGKRGTIRSDIYSLGLILYEIYTGKKAFNAKTLAELREQKETQTPRAPSEIREGIDPVVERVIQRCMEKNPNARPASLAQLAQALPGGDPLAAAIAAGETPSPEMVAASGGKEGLRPLIAWGLLAFIIVGTLAIIAMKDRNSLSRRVPFEKRPEVLVENSREILKTVGYTENFADCAYGFFQNSDLLRHIQESDKSADRWKNLDSKAILFWYRQSPRKLRAFSMDLAGKRLTVAPNNPPFDFPGEILIILDAEGNLFSLRAVPPQIQTSKEIQNSFEWEILFNEAGLDLEQWDQTTPQWNPLSFADTVAAWLPRMPDTPVRIEAAALKGKPVRFEHIYPWTVSAEKGLTPLLNAGGSTVNGFLFSVVVLCIFFAVRNLRVGRGDRRSATRLAVFCLGCQMLSWLLQLPHISYSVPGWLIMFAVLIWTMYIAIEPFVRRRWPQVLVSWTRLLSGSWRDPIVARDALIGYAFGLLILCILILATFTIPSLRGYTDLSIPNDFSYKAVLGARVFVSLLLSIIFACIYTSLALICLIFFHRVLLRNQKAAIVVFIVVPSLLAGFVNIELSLIVLILCTLYIFVIMRYGLMASVTAFFTISLFRGYPMTFESTWYSDAGYTALAIFATIVLYTFRTSLGGRPIFGTPRLDD